MKRLHMVTWLTLVLASFPPPASSGDDAGQLPTHLIIALGDDAWSGRLRALRFLPTLGTLDAPVSSDLWEAGYQLDKALPDARQLWTLHRGNAVARTPTPLRWEALSPSQQTELNADDGLGEARINYLRGARQSERDAARLRPRASILGAMRGAHAQLLGPPNLVLDASHAKFREQYARRPWMVYIGANDGLLHGFDAHTGEERFAVISDAVLPMAARNASPGQPVPTPVCKHPFAADALMGTQWHSLLVCGNGAMGAGFFLVDVTDPESSIPPPMLAYDATHDPTVGHIDGPIPIVPLADGGNADSRWYAVSGNGEGDPDRESRLLLLTLDQPHTVHSIRVPTAGSVGGLGAPAIALGPQGQATFVYVSDTRGKIWRFDLSHGPAWKDVLGSNDEQRKTPFFKTSSKEGLTQRILGPILLAATPGGPLLVFTAIDARGNATLYGVADTGKRDLSRESLAGLSTTETTNDIIVRPATGGTANGWHIDLPAGQVPDNLTTAGANSLLLTTRDAKGRDHAYLLDPRTGLPADKDGHTGHVLVSAPLITNADATPGRTPDGTATQTAHTSLWQIDRGRVRQMQNRTYTRQLGRLSWLEIAETGAY